MPVTCLNVTEIAHDDQKMEHQLLQETGRKLALDPEWSTITSSANGLLTFLYSSDVEFVLIKAECEVEFRRIVPVDIEAPTACISWDNRSGELYYIFKVDPLQKVIVAGESSVRFFRYLNEGAKASDSEGPQRTPESLVRPWEAEDIYQQRDADWDETFLPEHLAEASRRFEAWRAMTMGTLFVYLMVPRRLTEAEWVKLLENGIQFFDDVPWVL